MMTHSSTKRKYKRHIFNSILAIDRSGSRLNFFKYIAKNSDEHELAKFRLFMKLRSRGHDLFTEVRFTHPWNGKTDILDIDDSTCYEITVSENKKSILAKRDRYPSFLEIIPLTPEEVEKI